MNAYLYSAICAAVLVPLELFFPARRQQRLRKGMVCDLCHLALNALLIPIGLGFTAVAVAHLARFVPPGIPGTIDRMPLWAEVVLLFVVAEVMFYLAHRLVHAVPFLWRFHAIHHSSDELDFLSAVRGHPVDAVIHWSLVMTPLILLDLSAAMFAVYTVVFYIHSYVVHANVRLRVPLLEKLLVTPDFHHCHHEKSVRHNYAGMLALLDYLFRSKLERPGEHPDCPRGKIPNHYLAHFLHPFRLSGVSRVKSGSDEGKIRANQPE